MKTKKKRKWKPAKKYCGKVIGHLILDKLDILISNGELAWNWPPDFLLYGGTYKKHSMPDTRSFPHALWTLKVFPYPRGSEDALFTALWTAKMRCFLYEWNSNKLILTQSKRCYIWYHIWIYFKVEGPQKMQPPRNGLPRSLRVISGSTNHGGVSSKHSQPFYTRISGSVFQSKNRRHPPKWSVSQTPDMQNGRVLSSRGHSLWTWEVQRKECSMENVTACKSSQYFQETLTNVQGN